MKILYSAGERPGANIQLKRFIDNCNHDLRIATYYNYSDIFHHVDWTLDALKTKSLYHIPLVKELFGHDGVPRIDYTYSKVLFDDIISWGPDLIISDGEPIVAHIAKTLEIELWYCSPLHLVDGIEWENKQRRYILQDTVHLFRRMPKAQRKLIYSPFGDISMRPIIREGYEWVKPYHSAPNSFNSTRPASHDLDIVEKIFRNRNGSFSTGETSFVADAFYNEVPMFISPSMKDNETLLNAMLCDIYGIGVDLGKMHSIHYAVEKINEASDFTQNYLSIQNKTLDKKIDDE